jgi:hypothetical protein
MRTALIGVAFVTGALSSEAQPVSTEHRAAWLAEGSYGIMVHYLISPPGETPEARAAEFDRIVDGFGVDGFIEQFASTGADWLIFTIGQNTGYYCSPNEWLDARLPGHTSKRDLPREIATRLETLGKRFIAYLPSEVYGQTEEVHEAFAWNPADQSEFQRRYQEFVRVRAEVRGALRRLVVRRVLHLGALPQQPLRLAELVRGGARGQPAGHCVLQRRGLLHQ